MRMSTKKTTYWCCCHGTWEWGEIDFGEWTWWWERWSNPNPWRNMWISNWVSEGAIYEEDLLTKWWALALSQLKGGVEIHVNPTNKAMRESVSLCVGWSAEYSYRQLRYAYKGDSLVGWWEEENKMFENFHVQNSTCPCDVGVSTDL